MRSLTTPVLVVAGVLALAGCGTEVMSRSDYEFYTANRLNTRTTKTRSEAHFSTSDYMLNTMLDVSDGMPMAMINRAVGPDMQSCDLDRDGVIRVCFSHIPLDGVTEPTSTLFDLRLVDGELVVEPVPTPNLKPPASPP